VLVDADMNTLHSEIVACASDMLMWILCMVR
jgi:hypothetical protein